MQRQRHTETQTEADKDRQRLTQTQTHARSSACVERSRVDNGSGARGGRLQTAERNTTRSEEEPQVAPTPAPSLASSRDRRAPALFATRRPADATPSSPSEFTTPCSPGCQHAQAPGTLSVSQSGNQRRRASGEEQPREATTIAQCCAKPQHFAPSPATPTRLRHSCTPGWHKAGVTIMTEPAAKPHRGPR